MFTEKDWKDTRPKKAKGSGVKQTLKVYNVKRGGKQASALKGHELTQALEAALALGEACDTALGKIKTDKSPEADACRAMLKEAERELVDFSKKAGKLYTERKTEFEGILKGAAKAVTDQKKRVEAVAKGCTDDDAYITSALRTFEQNERIPDADTIRELKKLVRSAAQDADALGSEIDTFRREANVVELRIFGMRGLVRKFGISDDHARKFGQFDAVIREMQQLEKEALRVGTELRRVSSRADDAADEMDDTLSAGDKAKKILARAKADLEKLQQGMTAATLKDPTQFASRFDKKSVVSAVRDNPDYVKTLRGALETVEARMGRVSQIIAAVNKRYQAAINKAKPASDEPGDVTTLRDEVTVLREALLGTATDDAEAMGAGREHVTMLLGELEKKGLLA